MFFEELYGVVEVCVEDCCWLCEVCLVCFVECGLWEEWLIECVCDFVEELIECYDLELWCVYCVCYDCVVG